MLGCLIGLLFLGVALADYHYASHAGSDTYPYTSWETAADSIQEAINATSPHDTVYIGEGEWWETVAVEMYDSVAIIGQGIDSTFCYSDSARTAIMTIDYGCSVAQIAFRHFRHFTCLEALPYAGTRVDNCRFFQSGIGFISDGDAEIFNCVFDSCREAISVPLGIGDYLIANNLVRYIPGGGQGYRAFHLSVHSAVVRNNVILLAERTSVDAMVSGIVAGDVYIHNNLVVHGNSGITVDARADFNNTIIDMGWDPTYGYALAAADSIYNNEVSNCLNGIGAGDTTTVNYNNLWRNEEDFLGDIIDSIGNIFRDPMYVNRDSLDFRLQAFSSLIDAGDPNILDVDGTRSDIGVYGGPYGAFYDYVDLPPDVPNSISYRVWNDTIYLDWRENYEADFFGYQLHRDVISGFTPSPLNLIAEPESSCYADSNVVLGQTYYYRIASLDNQGNRSDYSPEIAIMVTGVWQGDGAEMPRMTVIKSNYPNPFNSATTLVYSVADLGPIPAEITIDIYDIMGRKVKTLVNERKEVGTHRVIWDGKGDNGEDAPSGIYFAKINQWGLDLEGKPRKITLVR
jgi:hypothetical protein